MRNLADKGVILLGCVNLSLLSPAPDAVIVGWLLVAVVCSALCNSCSTARQMIWLPMAYLGLACLVPEAIFGIPLAAYDLSRWICLNRRQPGVWALGSAAFILSALTLAGAWTCELALLVPFALTAATLAARTARQEMVQDRLHATRDELQEKVEALQESNARIQEAQDNELKAATLAERTRISRDIHDNVGHLLTRLIIQVRACQVVHQDTPEVVSDLAGIGQTIDEALDSMRRSVHALSDEGEDLPTALHLLGTRSGINQVRVDCQLESTVPVRISRCILAVVREALTNAARHGKATNARARVTEYPAFWQVIVDNEGTDADPGMALDKQPIHHGLGMQSMRDRVESLGGMLTITPKPRFTVFAAIPKESK